MLRCSSSKLQHTLFWKSRYTESVLRSTYTALIYDEDIVRVLLANNLQTSEHL